MNNKLKYSLNMTVGTIWIASAVVSEETWVWKLLLLGMGVLWFYTHNTYEQTKQK